MVATALHPLDGPAPPYLEKQVRKRSRALARSTPRDEEHAVELARVALVDYAALARTSEAWDYAERWTEASELVEPEPEPPQPQPELEPDGVEDLDGVRDEIVIESDELDTGEIVIESDELDTGEIVIESDDGEVIDIILDSDETEIVIDLDSGSIQSVPADGSSRRRAALDAPVGATTLAFIASAFEDIDDLYDASTRAHAIVLLGSNVVETVSGAVVDGELASGADGDHPAPELIRTACASAFRVGYATGAIALGLDAPLTVDEVPATTSTDRAAARLFLERLAPADGIGWFPSLGASVSVIVENSARHLATTVYAEELSAPPEAVAFVEGACHRCSKLGFALAVIEHDLTTEAADRSH